MKDYTVAASTFQQCINVLEMIDSDTNTERLASLMHKLGKSYTSSNDYDNALASYRESIKLYNEALGSDNVQVANVMYDVGLMALTNCENEKAAKCFTEVIRIYTLHDEEQSPKVADTLVQLGTIHADNCDHDESMECVKKAMSLYKEKLGNDAIEIGNALLLCGRLNDIAGDYDKMVSNFSEALRIFKTSLGDTDMNVSVALSNLGVALSRKLEYAEAVEKCKEALRIRKLHTANDRDVADSLFNIGNLYDEWGKHQDAIPFLQGSLKLYRSLLGDEDIAIANCQVKLGAIYLKSGDVDKGIDSFSDALYVCEEVDDDVENLLIHVYKGLGDCYFRQTDFELALESYASCLKIQKMELGDDCIEMADTCDCIGHIYQETGKHNESMQFYTKALQIHEQHHGKTSAQCLSSHIKISKALVSEEKYCDAIEHLYECIQLHSKDSQESEQLATIYQQLGISQNKLGKCEDAIKSINRAIDMRTKIYGKVDARVIDSMLVLGDALEAQDLDEASNHGVFLINENHSDISMSMFHRRRP